MTFFIFHLHYTHKKYFEGIFPQDLNFFVFHFTYYSPQEINSDNLRQ